MAYPSETDAVCLCRLLLLVALALLVCGLALFGIALRHTRAGVVAAYDRRVRVWESELRGFFEARAAFEVVATPAGGTPARPVTIELASTDAAEPRPLRDVGSDVLPHTPLRHEASGALTAGGGGGFDTSHVALTLRSRDGASGVACATPLGGDAGIALGYRQERDWPPARRSECSRRLGGSYVAGRGVCVTWHALAEVCVKVAASAREPRCWVPDAGGGGYGCEPGEGREWSVARYARLAGRAEPGRMAHERAEPGSMPPVSVVVRHAADPLIAARNLSAGSMGFGATDGVKALGGVELLVCAAGLGAPAVLFFLRRAACGRCGGRERERGRDAELEFAPLAGLREGEGEGEGGGGVGAHRGGRGGGRVAVRWVQSQS